METKTLVLVLIVVFTILLFLVIGFKIKRDKGRKSPQISPANCKYKKSVWESSPLLALYVLVLGFIIVFIIPEDWVKIETEASEAVFYILWGAVNAGCCFFIIRENPKSMWYVPLIINSILTAFVLSSLNFWKSIILISLFGIWLISIIASIIGARMGKKKDVSVNP